LHPNVDPALLEVKEKLAVACVLGFAGEAVMAATGGVRSIVQEKEAGADPAPAGLIAVTEKVWPPAARPV
jgi:hypothetical protein